MKCLIRHGGLWMLLLFCWLPSAPAQSSLDRIAKIVVTNVGPPAVSDDLIRANIHVKVGDPYIRTSLNEDILNLYATGYFFNIQVDPKFTPDGVILTYLLQGKLRLTNIRFDGNTRFSNEKLLRKVTSKIGEPLDERKLFADTQEIQKLYEKAGYPRTTVRYDMSNVDENAGKAGVTFQIKESRKIKITEVTFTGARAFPESKLRWVLKKTRRHWIFSWLTRNGIFREEDFEDDKERLADFYRNEGYIDFEIRDVKVTNPTPRTMKIEFVVYEGNQYRVGSVKFTGTNMLFTPEQLAAGLKKQHDDNRAKSRIGPNGLEADTGLVFTPQGLEHDIDAIEDFYGSKGYIDVRQGPNLRVSRVPNTETGTMDLQYRIDVGDKSYIEKIEIKGNAKTKDKVIRRELAVSPGEVFDMVRVRRSKERLEGLGFFEKVDTKIEPTVVPNRKNLIVGVDEKPTGQFTFGAGFNTTEGLLGYGQIEQVNFDLFNPPYFTGGGQKFRLRVQLGTESQDYRVSFVEPWFLDKKLTLSLELYRSEYDYQSLDSLYDETRTGLHLGLTRALGSELFIGSVGYTLEDIGIIHVNPNAPNTILAEEGDMLLNRFMGSLAYDTRNSYNLPTKGQRTELVGGIAVGSRTFYSLELGSSWYFQGFAPGHVIEIGGRIRVAKSLTGDDVPFFDRWYLGGQNSLRGYDYRGVGPRQVTQDGVNYEPIGGDTSWFGSIEYSLPVGIPRLRFAVFYDIGNVSAKPFSFSGTDVFRPSTTFPVPGAPVLVGNTGVYSDNWGVGLRLDLPIGPLRLDYGIPITHDKFNGNSGKFQFGVGFSRPF